VTFADLMGLLVSFLVMLVAVSTQDAAKLQVVAGFMCDAFGVQDKMRYSGIVEVLGLPTRPRLKNAAHIDPKEASATPSPEEHNRQRAYGVRFKQNREFALAAAFLRQALQDMPEITESAKTSWSRKPRTASTLRLSTKTGA
jgi:chemotaxis protein MotB